MKRNIFYMLSILFLFTACSEDASKQQDSIFSIYGINLGDTMDTVVEKVGLPDDKEGSPQYDQEDVPPEYQDRGEFWIYEYDDFDIVFEDNRVITLAASGDEFQTDKGIGMYFTQHEVEESYKKYPIYTRDNEEYYIEVGDNWLVLVRDYMIYYGDPFLLETVGRSYADVADELTLVSEGKSLFSFQSDNDQSNRSETPTLSHAPNMSLYTQPNGPFDLYAAVHQKNTLKTLSAGKVPYLPVTIGTKRQDIERQWGMPYHDFWVWEANYPSYFNIAFEYDETDRVSGIIIENQTDGLTQEKVMDLFGQPDSAEWGALWELTYNLGEYRLIIYFDYDDLDEPVMNFIITK
ncbi:hypothetical protein HNQ94_003010 [Salirhabdus euzebyi]|uniref:Uncharacterized protein n=1 Tax=Salirhabdus euzebyi TaxID=394506 RepID=A0A841Q7V2_9BACI|nr:DUF4309 domain-containing protein [Salirhabdus euzebyi]MBB6454521.1 hypothetical protein [Salirhabdus euzebyi]